MIEPQTADGERVLLNVRDLPVELQETMFKAIKSFKCWRAAAVCVAWRKLWYDVKLVPCVAGLADKVSGRNLRKQIAALNRLVIVGTSLPALLEPHAATLLTALGDNDYSVRLAALGVLNRLALTALSQHAPAIACALGDRSQYVQCAAVHALSRLPPSELKHYSSRLSSLMLDERSSAILQDAVMNALRRLQQSESSLLSIPVA